jgi:hypothetical protein
MRLFLSDSDTSEDAVHLTLLHIQNALEESSFVNRVGTGLMGITFFPDSDNESTQVPVGSVAAIRDSLTDETDMGMTSFVLVAVGSAALIVFVGSIYYLRQGNNQKKEMGLPPKQQDLLFINIQASAWNVRRRRFQKCFLVHISLETWTK